MRLHAHGAGRLQRGAQPGRLGRAPFHGHHRGRQMAVAPGVGLDAGEHRGRARARARERDRLLLRSQSRRYAARQGLRRPDLRSDGAQGRSHRHRDHQSADGAGVGATDPSPGRASRRGAHSRKGWRARGRAHDRYPHRRVPLRRGAGGAAGDRRRAHHVSLPYAVRRQEHGRAGDGIARRAFLARHGDGPVPSDRAARRSGHAHDRHGAGRGAARRRRPSPQRRDAPLHGRL